MNTRKILTANKIEYYTFTPSSDKQRLLVLKGIGKEYEPNDVVTAIQELDLKDITVVSASRLISNQTNMECAHFLVKFTPDSNTSIIYKQKRILAHAVRWDTFRKKRVMQCHNCQRAHHASIGCGLPYRCVKCLDSHEQGKCARIKDEQSQKNTTRMRQLWHHWTCCKLSRLPLSQAHPTRNRRTTNCSQREENGTYKRTRKTTIR